MRMLAAGLSVVPFLALTAFSDFTGYWLTDFHNGRHGQIWPLIQDGSAIYLGTMPVAGTVSGATFNFDLGSGRFLRGTLIDNNNIDGTWQIPTAGTWSGKRITPLDGRFISSGSLAKTWTPSFCEIENDNDSTLDYDINIIAGDRYSDLEFEFEEPDQIAVGTRTVAQGLVVHLDWNEGGTILADGAIATLGSVTITRYDTRLIGSYDLTFDNGVHIAGSFDVPVCDPRQAPATGTLSIDVEPNTGSWTITDKPGDYAGPVSGSGDLTATAAPVGSYTVSFGNLSGYTAPGPQTRSVAGGGHVVFYAPYQAGPHVVSVPGPPGGLGSVSTGQKSPYMLVYGGRCNQGHQVECRFDFGDGTISTYSTHAIRDYAWNTEGDYRVRCQARCKVDNSVFTDWSEWTLVHVRNPELHGIEVNQCIQSWRNDVTLIGGKTTLVKMDITSASRNPLTVDLIASRPGGATQVIGTDTVVPLPRDEYERDATIYTGHRYTPTFILDKEWTVGTVTFSARASYLIPVSSFLGDKANRSVTVSFVSPVIPRISLVPYQWEDASGTAIVPLPSEVQDVRDVLMAMLPDGETISFDEQPLRWTPSRQKPEGFGGQLSMELDIETLRITSGIFTKGVVLGIVPGGGNGETPSGSTLGWNCWAFVSNPHGVGAFAHEVGHAYGRHHTDDVDTTGGFDEEDPKDPNYPFADGKISGNKDQWSDSAYFGWNSYLYRSDSGSLVFNPPTDSDLMSYGWNLWPSKYTYEGMRAYMVAHGELLVQQTIAQARTLSVSSGIPSLTVIGCVDTNSASGFIKEVLLRDAPVMTNETGGRVLLQMKSANGELLHTATPLTKRLEQSDTLVFTHTMATTGLVTRVDMFVDGFLLDTFSLSTHAPTVLLQSPNSGDLGSGDVDVRWSADDPDGDALEATVLFSYDGGVSWAPLLWQLTGTNAIIDGSLLRGTSNGILRVTVTDGVHANSDSTDGAVIVPNRPPRVAIRSPQSGSALGKPISIRFASEVVDPENEEGIRYSWMSDIDGELSTNASFQVSGRDLSAGTHCIALVATDMSGLSATDTIHIVIVEDADSDDLPDWWEVAYGLPTDSALGVYGAHGDHDRDGVPNVQEFMADTNPTNCESFLGITGIARLGSSREVRWRGGQSVTQYLERSYGTMGAVSTWETIFTNVPPTATETNRLTEDPGAAPSFYRIRASWPR